MEAPRTTLVANFVADLREAQLAHLRREGYEAELDSKDETWVGAAWATAILQRIPRRPRKVHVSTVLQARADVLPLVKPIIRAIRKGLNLNPFLSTRHRRFGIRQQQLPNGKTIERPRGIDLAFAAFGIHHLHIAPATTTRVARTRDLLFAQFDEDNAYLINCYPHESRDDAVESPFAKRELLEIVYRNWPERLGPPIGVAGQESQRTDEETAAALQAGLTVPFVIDGKAFLVGGGLMTSTHSGDSIDLADKLLNMAASCQRECEARIDQIANAIGSTSGVPPSSVELRFVLRGRDVSIVTKPGGKTVKIAGDKIVLQ